jgi:hypothetical protein
MQPKACKKGTASMHIQTANNEVVKLASILLLPLQTTNQCHMQSVA